jgi:hypothetical protein
MAEAISAIGSPARSHADLGHVGVQERIGAVTGHQDAELDQPLDLGLGRAGEVGVGRSAINRERPRRHAEGPR